nr:hypothetical protein [uncultured Acetatifactor sp.]
MGRKTVVSIGAVAALAVFFCVGWWLGRSTERGEVMTSESGDSKQTAWESSDSKQMESEGSSYGQTEPESGDSGQTAPESGGSAPDGLLEAVLLGEAQFLYCSEGKTEAMDISGIPALFDGADPLMKIFDFAVVDLDGDGKEEVVLFVTGAAGDMGGKVILYQADSEVYGCSTDNRTLVDLKKDGTYSYSDPTGMAEAGIAAFSGFSREGYTVDKKASATGTYEGWDSFAVEGQPATEKEYMDMVSRQEEKQDAEWHEFCEEAIDAVF